MPARFRRLALGLPVLLTLALLTGGAPARVSAGSSFTYDTYFWSSSAPGRQPDLHLGIDSDDDEYPQRLGPQPQPVLDPELLETRDALNDSVQRGSDPLGWARAATYFSKYTVRPTTYKWEAYETEAAALKRAAYQIALYGKAVGLLVQHGRHAIVMTGFTASRNPLKGSFKVTAIYYSDPLGTRHSYVSAASSPLNSYRELDATSAYDAEWYGKYVIIVPRN